jgi:hypothetical protein
MEMNKVEQVEQLQQENRRLRAELDRVSAEHEIYRKLVQKLLPVENFDYDLDQLKNALAHPEHHQTLGEFLTQMQSELTGHGR